MALYNKKGKQELKKQLMQESFGRITLSFYRYVVIEDPAALRDQLYQSWSRLNVLGRIYVAHEGINAQLSLPAEKTDLFREQLYSDPRFRDTPFKIAVKDDGKSFYKLNIKVRPKIVADGLEDGSFDVTNAGKHLSAREFNEAMQEPGTVVVDMRNHYESEIGRFANAFCPDADTFKQALPIVLDSLHGKKDDKILLYCTGGIRCEKASAFLKHHGFRDVNQLHGGIISYYWQVQNEGLENKFLGKNFVFDARMGEPISGKIISTCHQCGNPCDTHVNCANQECHLLFIQCGSCAEKYNGCCTPACSEVSLLPQQEQRKIRKEKKRKDSHSVYKSRLRPNLREIIKNTSHA